MKQLKYIGNDPHLRGKTALIIEINSEVIKAQFDQLYLTNSNGVDVSHGWHYFPRRNFN